MRKRQIPGLSLAVMQNGTIVKSKGYGVTEKGGETPVTVATLFQAGSISKPVSALGALRLVEHGKLVLDEDVNAKLITWKVPENAFTREKKVTLRGLLSHTAGLTVHGFPGYATDGPLPTLGQVLNGDKPANTAAIRVDLLPGSSWRYSGGGYTVMQQMIVDVTGKPFPNFMQETVLGPLGMDSSTFKQPLPADKAKLSANGHLNDRSLVKGRWHIYPEMAAAGLWTTPTDLLRFALGVQAAYSGKPDAVLSQQLATQMLTVEKDNYGLGVALQGSGPALRFGHGGRDEGFDAHLNAYAKTGQGFAIMINANDNSRMISRIHKAVAREYHWPESSSSTPPKHPVTEVPEDQLVACSGRYEFYNNYMMSVGSDQGHLFTFVDGFPDEELLPETNVRFRSADGDIQVTFLKDGNREVSGFVWNEGGKERKGPRIGPLFRFLKPQPDPDPARTEKVVAVLKAFGKGGNVIVASPLLTPGARTDFSNLPSTAVGDVRSVVFLTERDVSVHAIERHKGKVNRVLHYRLLTDKAERNLLIHLTADGLITDFDFVED
jgi:CubicO group peptidase (beta-lactamase class C family)